MKLLNFKYHLLLIIILFTQNNSFAQNKNVLNKKELFVQSQKDKWMNLMPNFSVVNFFGGMGTVSCGVGWQYGNKRNWETSIFAGFIAKYHSNKPKMTFTIKQAYIPWKISINNKINIEPIFGSLYLNTILGSDFWVKDPDRYPKGYYSIPTKIRAHIGCGQRININLNKLKHKELSFYYEITSCDMYIITAVQNDYINLKDIISIAFGFKLQLF